MTVLRQALADLEAFAGAHVAHEWDVGALPTPGRGICVFGVCECGARVERWITHADVAAEVNAAEGRFARGSLIVLRGGD